MSALSRLQEPPLAPASAFCSSPPPFLHLSIITRILRLNAFPINKSRCQDSSHTSCRAFKALFPRMAIFGKLKAARRSADPVPQLSEDLSRLSFGLEEVRHGPTVQAAC